MQRRIHCGASRGQHNQEHHRPARASETDAAAGAIGREPDEGCTPPHRAD